MCRTFDADNRASLFEDMKAKGISVISAEPVKERKTSKNTLHDILLKLFFIKETFEFWEWCKGKFVEFALWQRICLIGSILVAIVASIYFGLGGYGSSGSGYEGDSGGKGGNTPISSDGGAVKGRSSDGGNAETHTQADSGLSDKGEEVDSPATPPPPPPKDWLQLQREAMARKLNRKKEHEIVYNDSNVTSSDDGRKPVHRNSTEHIMSMIFTTSLGDMPLPLPRVPERDKKRMSEILMDKFEILPDDPDAEEKKVINEVKDALSEHIRNGVDIDEFFAAYHRELESAHRKRTDARSMVLEAAKSGDYELAVEFLDKINKELEKDGIKPVNIPQWLIEKKARQK